MEQERLRYPSWTIFSYLQTPAPANVTALLRQRPEKDQESRCRGKTGQRVRLFNSTPITHRAGLLLVQLVVRLSVLVLVLRLLLPAQLLPDHGLFVVLTPVQAGALVDADAPHHLAAENKRGGRQSRRERLRYKLPGSPETSL